MSTKPSTPPTGISEQEWQVRIDLADCFCLSGFNGKLPRPQGGCFCLLEISLLSVSGGEYHQEIEVWSFFGFDDRLEQRNRLRAVAKTRIGVPSRAAAKKRCIAMSGRCRGP